MDPVYECPRLITLNSLYTCMELEIKESFKRLLARLLVVDYNWYFHFEQKIHDWESFFLVWFTDIANRSEKISRFGKIYILVMTNIAVFDLCS